MIDIHLDFWGFDMLLIFLVCGFDAKWYDSFLCGLHPQWHLATSRPQVLPVRGRSKAHDQEALVAVVGPGRFCDTGVETY